MSHTVTIYPTANYGRLISQDSTYSVARGGTNLLSYDANYEVGQSFGSGYSCFQSLLAFDTRILTGATILSAQLMAQVTIDTSDTDFTIEARKASWGPTVTKGDFVAGANLGSLTLLATLSTAGVATLVYSTFTDVALAANLDASDYTYLVLNSDRQRTNTAPTGNEFVTIADTLAAPDVFQPPKLVVTVDELHASWVSFPAETNDGWAENQSATYATALTTTPAIYDSLTYTRAGQYKFGSTYFVYETFLSFDTSSLQGATIIGADLQVAMATTPASNSPIIEVRPFDFGTSIDTGDWRTPTQLTALPLLASRNGTNSAGGIDTGLGSAVNASGRTRLVVTTANVRSATAPTGDESYLFRTADTNSPPRLWVLVHAPSNDDFANATVIFGEANSTTGNFAGSTGEPGEVVGAAGRSGMNPITTYTVPFLFDEMAFAQDGDVIYSAGGWMYSGYGVSVAQDPQGNAFATYASTYGYIGAVFKIDMMNMTFEKFCDLPSIDGYTWTNTDTATPTVGAYCVEAGGGFIYNGVMYISGGDNNYFGTSASDTLSYSSGLSGSDTNHVNAGSQMCYESRITLAIDLSNGTVTRKTDKPCGVDYCSAIGYGTKGYFVGGYTNWNSYPYIDIYDPAGDTWSRSSLGPYTIAEPTLAVYDNKIYVIGGYNNKFTTTPNVGADPTAWEQAPTDGYDGKVIMYDPNADTWSTGAARPPNPYYAVNAPGPSEFSTRQGAAIVQHGKIYQTEVSSHTFRDSSPPYDLLYQYMAYDPLNGTWTIETTPKPDVSRSYHIAGLRSDGKWFFIGGDFLTVEQPELQSDYGPARASLWWKWTAPVTVSMAFVSQTTDDGASLSVWTSNPAVGSPVPVAGGSGTVSVVRFQAVAGTTYYIQADGPAGGLFTLLWTNVGGLSTLLEALPIVDSRP